MTDRRPRQAVHIRGFVEGDWPAVAAIVHEVLAAGETYAMPVLDDAGMRSFWLGQPGEVVVAEVAGQVVGTAKMGPNRPAQGSHVGTASFMVSGGARGHGVGRALGEHVVVWHRAQGFRGIQFNAVVESNTAAVALWRALGFNVVGTVPGGYHPARAHGGGEIPDYDREDWSASSRPQGVTSYATRGCSVRPARHAQSSVPWPSGSLDRSTSQRHRYRYGCAL